MKLEERAKKWKDFMDEYCKHSMNKSYVISKDYDADILFINDTAQSVIFDYTYEKSRLAVLNFANPTNPGGGFLMGAFAQEESLCHDSNLYWALTQDHVKSNYYHYNLQTENDLLYTDKIVYSKNVKFFDNPELYMNRNLVINNPVLCDVITCAAPIAIYSNASNDEIYDIMKHRITGIFQIAIQNNVDILILGAFGCGAFGNDPIMVSNIFKECLPFYKQSFKKIIFAITDEDLFDIFYNVIS